VAVTKEFIIVFIFHPLPTLPPQGGGTNYNPLSPGGLRLVEERVRVRGIIMYLLLLDC